MQWTESKVEQLKELWEQGSVAIKIAKELGTSRCSVLGKANRLKLTPRRRGCLSGTGQPKQPLTISNNKPKETMLDKLEKSIEPENPISFEKTDDSVCRYPKWNKLSDPRLCCGRKVYKPYSYCAYHVAKTRKRVEGTKILDLNNKP